MKCTAGAGERRTQTLSAMGHACPLFPCRPPAHAPGTNTALVAWGHVISPLLHPDCLLFLLPSVPSHACADSASMFPLPAHRGDFGRLGHGDCNDVFIPQTIGALSGRNVVKMACGDTHTLAVTSAGELLSFGRNQNGQLGLGSTQDAIVPQPVEALKVSSLPCLRCASHLCLTANYANLHCTPLLLCQSPCL